MSASRREFLVGLGAAGVIAGIPLIAHASPGVSYPPMDLSLFDNPLHRGDFEVRFGYSVSAWNGRDAEPIEDISAFGYKGIHLHADSFEQFPDPAVLRDILLSHNLQLLSLSGGEAPLDPAKRLSTLDAHVKNAQRMHAAGGKYLQVIGDSSQSQKYSAADYRYQGQLLTEIGKRVADYGIQTAFRNRIGSIGQTQEGVDAILDAADYRYVKLDLDVAHYLQGGGDPAVAIRKYGRRVLAVHLKDVTNASTHNGYEFVELGQGRVDFQEVFSALRSTHFRGWGIVEQPNASHPMKLSAEMSKIYLDQKTGVHA